MLFPRGPLFFRPLLFTSGQDKDLRSARYKSMLLSMTRKMFYNVCAFDAKRRETLGKTPSCRPTFVLIFVFRMPAKKSIMRWL